MIKVKKGNEVYRIDAKQVADFEKRGFKVVPQKGKPPKKGSGGDGENGNDGGNGGEGQ